MAGGTSRSRAARREAQGWRKKERPTVTGGVQRSKNAHRSLAFVSGKGLKSAEFPQRRALAERVCRQS
eukprot:852805-Amphidinium_carterae.1